MWVFPSKTCTGNVSIWGGRRRGGKGSSNQSKTQIIFFFFPRKIAFNLKGQFYSTNASTNAWFVLKFNFSKNSKYKKGANVCLMEKKFDKFFTDKSDDFKPTNRWQFHAVHLFEFFCFFFSPSNFYRVAIWLVKRKF